MYNMYIYVEKSSVNLVNHFGRETKGITCQRVSCNVAYICSTSGNIFEVNPYFVPLAICVLPRAEYRGLLFFLLIPETVRKSNVLNYEPIGTRKTFSTFTLINVISSIFHLKFYDIKTETNDSFEFLESRECTSRVETSWDLGEIHFQRSLLLRCRN